MTVMADGGDIAARLSVDLERVEARLRDLAQVDRAGLAEAVGFQVGGSRRRLRPQLALLAHYMTTDDDTVPATDRAIDASTAVEMLHVASLYHDDVIDGAAQRHGRESVNARWGDGMAILSGDYTMIRASGLLAQLGRREALLLADLGCLMAEGMVAEMLERYDVDRSEEAALAVVTNKTATLMSGSCAVGVLQGCRDDACIDAMLGFGRHFGIGYQLLDDLLDLTATAEQLGKPVGNDIREGIYTLPLLRALQRDPSLRPLLGPEITDAEIAQVLGRVRAGAAVEEVLTLVAQHVDQAVTHLRQADCAHARPRIAAAIEDFARTILSRQALNRRPRGSSRADGD
ncbi:polyprenyl synthetase family protein [Streptomyces chattanoogensis]|uniref:polyprenyl synthetase family protein n=1 Tax=Streptomyces chattanoogensis TaxID=66876 RepID=UPI00367BCE21